MSPVDIKKIAQFWEQDTARKQAMGVYGKRDGRDFFTIKDDGEYEVRVLELGTFYAGSHWGILRGKEGRNGGTVKCPRVFDGSPCPVCELVEQMANSDDPQDRKQAEDWAVQVKHPILLLDVNEEGGKIVPRIYEAPKTVYGGIVKYLTNPKYGNILDVEKGRNVTIVRGKNSRKGITEYDVICDPERSAVDVDPENLPNLEEMLKPRSYEDIEHAIQEGEYPPQKEEQEEKPKRGLAKPPPTPYKKGLPGPKTRDEEPEEVEDEVQEEEEVEEAPPPKRPSLMTSRLGPKKQPPPAEVAEEEEPEEEVEEEATPPPKKSAPPAAAPGKMSVKDRLLALKQQKKGR